MKSKKKLITTSFLVAILALTLVQATAMFAQTSTNIQFAKANSLTKVVPDDYPTISAALGNATQGDTILVKKGTYYENPVIDKSVTVTGENSENTIVYGDGGVDKGARPVFKIAADDVKLSNFTIKSINQTSSGFYATGIMIAGDRCTVTGNNIVGTYYGIFSSVQSSIVISQNSITAVLKDAIRICGGASNTISNNNITGNAVSGIALDGYSGKITGNYFAHNGRAIGIGAAYSVIFGNNMTANIESGIFFASSNCIVSSNNIAGGKYGVYFTPYLAAPHNDKFYNNNFVNNSQQVYISSPSIVETWDNNSSGGNYWSNYNGTDANGNGIGDSAYSVSVNNTDSYPLIAPISTLATGAPPAAIAIPLIAANSTVASWQFDEVLPNGVTPDQTGNNPAVYGPATWNVSSGRVLVEGKSGKALSFNGTDYDYVAVSPSLDLQNEITIDAWVYVKEFKNNVSYNNIVVDCARSIGLPSRVWGFAINGDPSNSSVPVGVLRGFILDKAGTLNEIATTATLPLNQWMHVVFTRSLTAGMHIFINDTEQNVQVTSGVQNPTEPIQLGNEIYIGHDSITTLDAVSISNFANQPVPQPTSTPTSMPQPQSPSTEPAWWMQWWFWSMLVGAGFAVTAITVLLFKRNGPQLSII